MPDRVIEGDCIELMKAMPDASVDAVVCDPPYGLSKEPDIAEVLTHWLAGDDYTHRGSGFMGKSWDSFVPGPVYWREAFRVLKPGGHLVAFGGARTYDLLVIAVRFAGFEVRDQLQWLYGSGFPKSHDVAKAIDAEGGSADFRVTMGDALRAERERRGLTIGQADDMFCGGSTNWGWMEGRPWRGRERHIQLPRPELAARIAEAWPAVADVMNQAHAVGERMGTRTHTRSGGDDFAKRPGSHAQGREVDVFASGTDAADEWAGWGTALKPAHEPIVLARKPLIGTVAQNVLAHGTGAINVDGCRIEHASDADRESAVPGSATSVAPLRYGGQNHRPFHDTNDAKAYEQNAAGRWPANVLFDEEAARLLDQQTGESVSRVGKPRGAAAGDGWGMTATGAKCDDSGGASRFFYVAKASTAERNAGLVGFPVAPGGMRSDHSGQHITRRDGGAPGPRENPHPTVKPVELMRWLCRLVTPPDGLVLDPFAGSGTTGIACALEHFRFTGFEHQGPEFVKAHPGEDDYVAIANTRMAWWRLHPDGMEIVKALTAERERGKKRDAGQDALW